ncbi:Protein CBG02702 [Caenorhabditis briggsae]|uniref:Protein CBG02702 n=1 Tax=Caenorhabditis briggsae TaxID=6238 RepID=A8WTQ0_CAEBR|nr:Protein CBG02702 [Caenorhabditis briggsae]CAP23862.2 Protein CBG02702 [Caenorhabditis briggsae]
MDRDTFSDSRRARHFGRSNQNSLSFNNFARSENHRRNLRDTYLSETSSSEYYNTSFSPMNTRNSPAIPSYFDESSTDLSHQLNGFHLDDYNRKMLGTSASSLADSNYLRSNRLSSLPSWALDENREIRCDLTLRKVVEEGLVLSFSMDKSGCHFLQSNYFGENTQNVDPYIRDRVSREVLGSKEVFLTICKNIFGNFFLQRVIEYSTPLEQETIKKYIVSDITALCLDKSACRVVQTALEKLEPRFADAIVAAIPRKNRLMSICTDQNANHVIQKIIKKMPLKKWEFLVIYLCKQEHDNLLDICQDKYGCRVVQTIVEVLSEEAINKGNRERRVGHFDVPPIRQLRRPAYASDLCRRRHWTAVFPVSEILVSMFSVFRDTHINGIDFRHKFENWLAKLYVRARREKSRLNRFSSGKKILDILQSMEGYVPTATSFDLHSPFPQVDDVLAAFCPSSLFSPSATTTSNDWTSRTTSISSEPHFDYDFNFNNYQKF